MNPMLAYVIELVVAVFAVAYLVPPALLALANANTTGVNAAVVTILQVLLPILIILGLALALMPKELKQRVGI